MGTSTSIASVPLRVNSKFLSSIRCEFLHIRSLFVIKLCKIYNVSVLLKLTHKVTEKTLLETKLRKVSICPHLPHAGFLLRPVSIVDLSEYPSSTNGVFCLQIFPTSYRLTEVFLSLPPAFLKSLLS